MFDYVRRSVLKKLPLEVSLVEKQNILPPPPTTSSEAETTIDKVPLFCGLDLEKLDSCQRFKIRNCGY